MRVYPNPVNQLLTIEYYLEQATFVQLYLVSTNGETNQQLEKSNLKPTGFHQLQIATQNLSTGMYVVKGIIGEKVLSKKIIIIK